MFRRRSPLGAAPGLRPLAFDFGFGFAPGTAGVGLPGHFIAKASGRGEEIYFDPFHGGRVLSVADCEALVERVAGGAFQATPEVLPDGRLRLYEEWKWTNGDLSSGTSIVEEIKA